jgi:predicted 3-demethylubiquinone-9 3-methyltransferase (glyoxalase superfamily)
MRITRKIAPCLWFDDQAEAAAGFSTGSFKNSFKAVLGMKKLDIAELKRAYAA